MKKYLAFFVIALLAVTPSIVGAQIIAPIQFNPENVIQQFPPITCSVAEGRITYIPGGINKLEYAIAYTTQEDREATLRYKMIDNTGEVILDSEQPRMPLYEFRSNPLMPNMLLANNGQLAEMQFFSHAHTSIRIEASIDNVPCTPRTYTIIDPLRCSMSGVLSLVDGTKNKLVFGINYSVPEDRRVGIGDIPYTFNISLDANGQQDLIISDNGTTALVADESRLVFRSGQNSSWIQFPIEENDLVRITGSIGGKVCTPAKLALVQPEYAFPIDVSDFQPGQTVVFTPPEQEDPDAVEPDLQGDIVVPAEPVPVAPDVSGSRCSVIAEGVTDSQGRVHIASALQYKNVPQGNFSYQFISYLTSAENDKQVHNANMQVENQPNGITEGPLFIFDPKNDQDAFIIHGLLENLVCDPVRIAAPIMRDDSVGSMGNAAPVAGAQVLPVGVSPEVVAQINQTDLGERAEMSASQSGNDTDGALASDTASSYSQKNSWFLYAVVAVLVGTILFLVRIIYHAKKQTFSE
ncbi:MAG: hypothetical protein KBD15_02685 [Candidatus Magasanikbacteria bacterium]|nr:hypothetical protein [Candidatus Magasanikbacteria bacterium]